VSARRRSRIGCAAAALAALAACGPAEPENPSLFIRDLPAHPAPITPAPDLSDIRPVPDLQANRKALAMLCNVRGVDSPDVCACIARAGDDAFGGRRLALFAAYVIADEAEIARLKREFTEGEQAILSATYAAIALRCGSRSLDSAF
jgi:hypothetical protein